MEADKAVQAGSARSAPEAERREIGVGIEGVDPFGLLELRADHGRHGGHERFDEHLEGPVGEHHAEDLLEAPDAEERDRVEDQAVDALTDERRTDETRPRIFAAHAHLHLREHIRVEEVADAESDDRAERDAPATAEARLESRLQLGVERRVRAGRHREHDPGHDRREEHRREAGPDHAPRERVAIDFGEDVAEDIGEREEQDACAEVGLAEEGQVELDDLRRADEVRTEQHRDESAEDEVVIAEAAGHRRSG